MPDASECFKAASKRVSANRLFKALSTLFSSLLQGQKIYCRGPPCLHTHDYLCVRAALPLLPSPDLVCFDLRLKYDTWSLGGPGPRTLSLGAWSRTWSLGGPGPVLGPWEGVVACVVLGMAWSRTWFLRGPGSELVQCLVLVLGKAWSRTWSLVVPYLVHWRACSRTWSLGGPGPVLGPWEGLV